ncbi:hypothetical protein ASD15_22010 [Massilia sp. Root351]|jgi:transcriptional regulator with XRE-family HTH domain|uniref:helix-turn-helix domain-containing protein n=1 Tax=Massilia sp. Root351 TaxID=1736522 RepID=UPI000710A727|nr:helix-turn-helix transcriptional regulator [Massilia sp. Root351]KQV78490.1 hypothetical protein ASD15_22010 [Massilia sp. Root351]
MKWFERLSVAREAKGFKKAHFAKAIGVKPPTITEWERGDTAAPSATNVMNICKVLNITPEWLMSGASQGAEGIPLKTYFGSNSEIAEAVSLMEQMPAYELAQALGIIKTLAGTKRPEPSQPQN